ncbi:ABC transporter permease [Denitratisoma oestradiolicum]|uniref:Transport permease protein n=2 Tax=Denitratisoma oestradiolicum TaxID=311182 RepID=A0A6S6Y5V4_9PROT|nr:ABC transporter permease [Denitratisoma oestradiolicum]CAB1370927.1 Nodulation protein J [Denitratisoma oestradiolicum]
MPLSPLRWIAVWRRNFLVWRKMAFTSVLGNLADPLIYMFGLGYGLGSLVSQVEGMPYIVFIASGSICASTMNGATFEALYSAFSRMQVQRTWDAILNAPLALEDVLLGEWIWAASKAVLSGLAIIAVMGILGFLHSPLILWVVPLLFLVGLCFAAMGLIVTALAPSFDFFMYYFTLLITPMTLLSGVFFPLQQLPAPVQAIAQALPLTHAVALVRPLSLGQVPEQIALHLVVLAVTALAAFALALKLARRRLLF